jgi:exopolysaccharide production protein ExoZ
MPVASPASAKGPDTPQSSLLTVQYLRAIAALMVAYFHTMIQIPAYTRYFREYLLGSQALSSGVDIFFVISGFIMLISNRNTRPGVFAVRRVIRIVPLYWVLTSLIACLTLLYPQFFHATVLSLEYFLKSLLFIPYANPGQEQELVPLLVPGWSLNYEMFFYCIFALVLFAAQRWRLAITGGVFALLTFAGYEFRPADHRAIFFFTDIRIVEFWLGMLIADLFLHGRLRFPPWLPWTILIAGFTALLWKRPMAGLTDAAPGQSLLANVLPSAAIVLGAVALEQSKKVARITALAFLGDASYSIYLSHVFSLGVARLTWSKFGLEKDSLMRAAGFAVYSMVAVIIGSVLVYRLVEKPMLIFLQKMARRNKNSCSDSSLATGG